jgi:hypothetical protein
MPRYDGGSADAGVVGRGVRGFEVYRSITVGERGRGGRELRENAFETVR